jgi:predicted dehydrogenase
MTIRIGIIGMGGMGINHYNTYARVAGAKIVAICDTDPKKCTGDWSSVQINIGGEVKDEDLSALKIYPDAELMFNDPDVDAVDITLPTFLHAEYAIRAMKAGKDVICEKPMALTPQEAEKMLECAKATGKQLFIAQCIRFWPQYVVSGEIVKSKKYGEVKAAYFVRRSASPLWSWDNWLMDQARSGGCVLDMHIHDSDFILHLFGMPKSVSSAGTTSGLNCDVISTFHYDDDALIVAEGGWGYQQGFPFSMTFTINMETATLCLDDTGKLMLYEKNEKPVQVEHDCENGYYLELVHFIQCITDGKKSEICPPASACQTLKLVYGEIESIKSGKPVSL